MDRKDFFKKACLFGVCSCAGMGILSSTETYAATSEPKDDDDWRIGFMQSRFAKLVDVLKSTVDEKTKSQILEEIGKFCAQQGIEKNRQFIGNIEGYLKNIETNWAEKASYDKENKEIKIVGRPTGKCFCPFVDQSKISKDFCNCSLGWQKETFKTLMGQEVTAKIDESVLYGGKACCFTIKVI